MTPKAGASGRRYRETIGCIPVFTGTKDQAKAFTARLERVGLGTGTRTLPLDLQRHTVLITRASLKQRDKIFALWGAA